MAIKVVELFAGVGGFRQGLDEDNFDYVWANQWEPGTKVQHAFDCYEETFDQESIKHKNKDIV